MKKFCGRFHNDRGDQLIITEVSQDEARCDFISGVTNLPIERPYFENRLSINMKVEWDYYKSSIEIDLGNELKYCLDDLDYPIDKAQTLSGGISRPADQRYHFLEKYTSLYGLKPFKRIE